MLELVTTGQFRKDYKRMKKRGCNMNLLEDIIDLLLREQQPHERHRDHALVKRKTLIVAVLFMCYDSYCMNYADHKG